MDCSVHVHSVFQAAPEDSHKSLLQAKLTEHNFFIWKNMISSTHYTVNWTTELISELQHLDLETGSFPVNQPLKSSPSCQPPDSFCMYSQPSSLANHVTHSLSLNHIHYTSNWSQNRLGSFSFLLSFLIEFFPPLSRLPSRVHSSGLESQG